jgi:hypothetical protein
VNSRFSFTSKETTHEAHGGIGYCYSRAGVIRAEHGRRDAQKKAESKQEAKAKHFRIHWIKRDRWVKNCIAARHT